MARTTTNFGFSSTATEVLEGVDLGGKRAIVTGGASDRQKLKGDRVLLMRTELRINHLSKSAMYKIVQSNLLSCSIKRRRNPLLIWRHVQVTRAP
jgi:hypothetical protein